MHDLLGGRAPLQRLINFRHRHQHPGMTASQKTLEPRPLIDKGCEEQAQLLRFTEPQGLLRLDVGLDTSFGESLRIAVQVQRLVTESLGHLPFTHHQQYPLDV
ncbi:hypothetical protein D3C80_1995580 [compost metagenome]